MSNKLINPFDHNHFVGYVSFVSPGFVKVHFPSSILLKTFNYAGEQNYPGMVGSYVAIEGDNLGFLGKIIEMALPESERLELNESSFYREDFHPVGKIEILLGFDFFNRKIKKGINQLPTIGAKVFICSGKTFADFFQQIGVNNNSENNPSLFDLGKLNIDYATNVKISSQAILSRHCAIIGTTGGGKSYTLSKIIEELINNHGKGVLIDPSGEYKDLCNDSAVQTVTISSDTFFHYSNLTIGDIFVLLRPGGQVQSPKLLEAIKSLKLVEAVNRSQNIPTGMIIQNGLLVKASQNKTPFKTAYQDHLDEVESINADFVIRNLSNQILNECVYEAPFNSINYNLWGGADQRAYENCTSLIVRLNSLLSNTSFKSALGFDKLKTDASELRIIIEQFLNNNDKRVLRINLESVDYEFNLREVLVNALGKYFLEAARKSSFKNNPIVLFLDEAHQFLNKSVKDEFFDLVSLDSFDVIAKECRKYGLFLVLATQMPRDIPIGTLSQVGTFIIHRLINEKDKEIVSNACQEANKSVLSFLPILSEGEAIILGVDIPMPIILKINMPKYEPDSKTPIAIPVITI